MRIGSLLLYVVYRVTIVVIRHRLLKKFWSMAMAAFYALQGVPLFETMQTRLLHKKLELLSFCILCQIA